MSYIWKAPAETPWNGNDIGQDSIGADFLSTSSIRRQGPNKKCDSKLCPFHIMSQVMDEIRHFQAISEWTISASIACKSRSKGTLKYEICAKCKIESWNTVSNIFSREAGSSKVPPTLEVGSGLGNPTSEGLTIYCYPFPIYDNLLKGEFSRYRKVQAHHLLRTEECLRSSAESEHCKEEHYEKICFSIYKLLSIVHEFSDPYLHF